MAGGGGEGLSFSEITKLYKCKVKYHLKKINLLFKDPFWYETEESYLKKCRYTGREVSAS